MNVTVECDICSFIITEIHELAYVTNHSISVPICDTCYRMTTEINRVVSCQKCHRFICVDECGCIDYDFNNHNFIFICEICNPLLTSDAECHRCKSIIDTPQMDDSISYFTSRDTNNNIILFFCNSCSEYWQDCEFCGCIVDEKYGDEYKPAIDIGEQKFACPDCFVMFIKK